MFNWKRIFISGPFFVAAMLVHPGVYGMDQSSGMATLLLPPNATPQDIRVPLTDHEPDPRKYGFVNAFFHPGISGESCIFMADDNTLAWPSQ